MKENNSVKYFGFFIMRHYIINMKIINHKNIAYADFVNVYLTLNLHFYDEN